ncbi:hypothetical protein ABFS82_11G085600 [Erythranthe guttata]
MAPNTLILRAIPGLNEIRKALLGTVAEQVMLLENIGTSVLVSGNQLPELHALMVEAASILNIDTPDLYLRQSPVSNAYTLAISGKKPFVVVHTSLVELLSRKELQNAQENFQTGEKRHEESATHYFVLTCLPKRIGAFVCCLSGMKIQHESFEQQMFCSIKYLEPAADG